MTVLEILTILQNDIHTAVFAAVDESGLPQTCVIDLMPADENGLCFLTANGYVMETSGPLLALYEQYGVICNFSGHLHIQHTAQSEQGLWEIAIFSRGIALPVRRPDTCRYRGGLPYQIAECLRLD